MKVIKLTAILCLVIFTVKGQPEYKHNGINLAPYCQSESCVYSALENPIVHVEDEVEHWKMYNVEFAAKRSGDYLITGDLAVSGQELGAKIVVNVYFYDENDVVLKEIQSGLIEFYSEPGHAEPFYVSGKLNKAIGPKVAFINIDISSSEVIPYYEISSDCYVACKEHRLNEAIKVFKKAK
ncbi:MAG: hypothetical protein OCD76_15050 [Reichenbachiella sp.]